MLTGTIATETADGLYYDYHNYGYVLKYEIYIHVATFHAKLIFHFELPDWNVRFDDDNIRCHSDTNVTLPCYQLREVLNVVSKIRSDMQVHTQHQIRHIHQLVRDLPIDRSKRGLMTQLLSRITGFSITN